MVSVINVAKENHLLHCAEGFVDFKNLEFLNLSAKTFWAFSPFELFLFFLFYSPSKFSLKLQFSYFCRCSLQDMHIIFLLLLYLEARETWIKTRWRFRCIEAKVLASQSSRSFQTSATYCAFFGLFSFVNCYAPPNYMQWCIE